MTHDELLAKINKAISIYEEQGFDANDYLYALRAVVELHSMIEQGELFIDGDRYGVTIYMCGKCNVPYPCEDIQAIERQLNS